MNTRCSICGVVGKGIRFKTGYVCEKCLNYIRNTDPESPDEHILCSDVSVNGSEGKRNIILASGTRSVIINQSNNILTRNQK